MSRRGLEEEMEDVRWEGGDGATRRNLFAWREREICGTRGFLLPLPFPMDTYRGETLRLPIVETNIESPKFPSTRQLKWGHTGEGMIGQ